MSITTWDIETTIKQRFKRKATPFGGLNHVVLHGWKNLGTPAVHSRYFGRQAPGSGWLREVLVGTKLLVGFNIKFDLLHALQDEANLQDWMHYVATGGQVWDCQLAEYLLQGMGQREHMLSLDEVAPRYGGNVKIDEVKALWNAGVDTVDIDPELLTRYLIGGPDETGTFQLGDVENTEKIALAQIKRARECGQLNSIMLNMGALLFTVEAERNGMFIDVELGLKLAEELRIEVARLKVELERYLPPEMPFEFKWTSRFHKSALIFGGTVQWDAYEYDLADGTTMLKHEYDTLAGGSLVPGRVYSQMDEVQYVLEDGTTTAVNPVDDTADRKYATFKGGKNAGEFKTKKVKVDNLDKPKGRTVKAPFTFRGFTEPRPEWQSSDPGVYSTASEVIEALSTRGIPFLTALAELQSQTKDLGTYYIVTDEETGEQKGMLSMVDEHGLIHHKLNMTNTVTARLSSSDPNLQNVSGKDKSKVKMVFVSRFAGGKIIQSDFTALEVYVQALLTGCRQLIEDLRAGLDMHCVRVSQKEGIPYEEAVKLCKGYVDAGGKEVDADPVWKLKRKGAKEFSFQRAYGAGANKISESTGIPLADVEALAKAEDIRYPEVPEYYAALTDQVKANRRPGGQPIPHPQVRGVMCNLGSSFVRTPDGKLYSYQEQPSPEYLVKRGQFQSFSPTEIKNYVVQGTGGEWAKAAMWLSVRAFYARKNFGGLGLLVNQVHDAVYSDAHPDVAQDVADLLHACMEGASDFMEYYFTWHIAVPVPSETTWGSSMMEEKSIPGVKDRAQLLRKGLRDLYMGGHTPSFLQ